MFKGTGILAGVLALAVWGASECQANVEQVKIYKTAFPQSKPQCLFCHIDKLPKKEEGKHQLNAYGLKVKETLKAPDEKPTEETYKALGTVEEFEARQKEETK